MLSAIKPIVFQLPRHSGSLFTLSPFHLFTHSSVVATAVHMSTSTTAAKTNDEKSPLFRMGLSRLASTHLRQRLLQQHAKTSITMTLLVRCVSRFLKPLYVLCGAILVASAFVRGNYSA